MKLIGHLCSRLLRAALIIVLILAFVLIANINRTAVGDSFSLGPVSYTRNSDFSGELKFYDYARTINPTHTDGILNSIQNAVAVTADLAAKIWSHCFPVLQQIAGSITEAVMQVAEMVRN